MTRRTTGQKVAVALGCDGWERAAGRPARAAEAPRARRGRRIAPVKDVVLLGGDGWLRVAAAPENTPAQEESA